MVERNKRLLKQAILHVISAGNKNNNFHDWKRFHEHPDAGITEEVATNERNDFAEAVLAEYDLLLFQSNMRRMMDRDTKQISERDQK